MKTNRLAVLILTVAVAGAAWRTSPLAGQNNPSNRQAQAALQAAMNKEMVDGNLDAAIQQYKAIVSKYPRERTVVADALIHMAECYQKLGDAQARKIFEQIVREYGDQTAATAKARAHLGSERASGTATMLREVWSGSEVAAESSVSPDGRYISYPAWDTGDLAVRDTVTGTNRLLTNNNYTNGEFAQNSSFSPDGKQLAYAWYDGKNRYHLRLSNWQSAGNAQPQILYDNPDVGFVQPYQWSPDGKWIATQFVRKDNTPTQIGLVSVDGSARVLTTLNSLKYEGRPRRSTGLFVSPDGKFLAFDQSTSENDIDVRDVFVIAVDGSGKAQPVIRDARAVMGWSPDGTRLLFMSDRASTAGLWALPFADGKAQGPPELLKSDLGSSVSLGLTASGALYVYKSSNTRDIAIAPIDLNAGKLLGPPVGFTEGFIKGSRNPMWSRDGEYLAYSCTEDCIAIRTVATGQVRRLPHTLSSAHAQIWSPDGRSLLTVGKDAKGREGIFQINAQSGESTAVILGDQLWGAQWSPDGKKVYFTRNRVFVERDLASGAERDVYAGGASLLSHDGQYFVDKRAEPTTKTASLLLVPVAGGQPRELLRLTQPERFAPSNDVWTPDSSAVIMTKDTGSRKELWLVPINGGPPRKLDIDPNIWLEGNSGGGDLGFMLSPDGRRIAFQMGKTAAEVWALENFLPASKAKK